MNPHGCQGRWRPACRLSVGLSVGLSVVGLFGGGARAFADGPVTDAAAPTETPAADAGAPTAGPATPAVTLNGYARGDAFVGKVSGAPRPMAKAAYGEASLTLRTARTEHGDGFAEVRVRSGLQGEEQRTFLDLREAYANLYAGRVDLRLGQQIIVWGRADALNPTNNLTPIDFRIRSPLEDDIRVGNVGARAFVRLAPLPLRLEGVWMPAYVATQLPPVALPQYVSYGPPVPASLDLSKGLGAGRLHLELPSFELSVSYLQGYAPLPGLTMTSLKLTGMREPPPSVVVSRTPYQHRVIGFDFSTALGDVVTLRGEAAYRRPLPHQDPGHTPRPDVQFVLGADHGFGAVSVIAQYMGRVVFDWQKQNGPAMPLDPSMLPTLDASYTDVVTDTIHAVLAKTNQILFSQTARVQHLGTVRVEWLGLHDTLSISTLAVLNVTTQEWVVTPRIGYRISDTLTAYLGGQIFHGPRDTLFGLIDAELSAGYAELRVLF